METFQLTLRLSDTGAVITNVDEIAAKVLPRLETYRYEVTPENYKQAKKEVTELRKLVTRSKAERSRVQKEVESAWKEPKQKLMELEKAITDTAENLNAGVKEIEAAEERKTYEKYRDYWNCLCEGATPFELVFDESFMKKGMKDEKVYQVLNDKWSEVRNEWLTLQKLTTGHETADRQLKELFFKTLDSTAVVTRFQDLSEVLEGEYTEKPTESPQASESIPDINSQEKQNGLIAAVSMPDRITESVTEPADSPLLVRQWITEGTAEQYEALYDSILKIGIKLIDIQKMN